MLAFFNSIAGKIIPVACMVFMLGTGSTVKTVLKAVTSPLASVLVQAESKEDSLKSREAKTDSLKSGEEKKEAEETSKPKIRKYKDKVREDSDKKPMSITISDKGVRIGSKDGEEVYLNVDAEKIAEDISEALEGVDLEIGDLNGIIDLDKLDIDDREFREVYNNQIFRFGKNIHIGKYELVRGDVVALFGNIEVDGKVTGDVVSILGDIEVGPTAIVNGEVISVLGTLSEDDDAQVRGQTVIVGGSPDIIGLPFHTSFGGGLFRLVGKIVSFIVGALLFLLIVYFLPDRMRKSSDFVFSTFFKSLGFGILMIVFGGIIVAIVAGILSITIIGIPVAILLALSFAALIMMGYFVSALALGRFIAGKLNMETDSLFIHGLLGLFLLAMLGLLASMMWFRPMFFAVGLLKLLSVFLNFLAVFTGTGAFILSKAGLLDSKIRPELPE